MKLNRIISSEHEKKDIVDLTKKYSTTYRILKTLMLFLAWISFGINSEIIGSTLEDLKILLNLNYETVSFGLTIRNIGFLVTICFSGILYDKLSKYAELIMAISGFFLILRKFKSEND